MIKTAIIGLGPHGHRIVEACKLVAGLELLALVDQNADVLSKFPDEKCYTNYAEMLQRVQPECLIIATNGPSHYVIANQAIKAGVKYLMISKPLTCRLSEAQHLVKLANEKNVRIAVDHGLRYDITYEYVREFITKGNLGDLLHVYIMRNGIGLGCLGVHSFDLANSLFNDYPIQVSAWVDEPILKNPRGNQFVDPGGTVVMVYPNGRRALIEQSEAAIGSFFTEIHGTNGKIQLDSKNGIVSGLVKTKDGLVPFFLPGDMVLKHDTITLMARVLDSLISVNDIKADAIMGMHSLEILVAAYESSENGHIPISLPLLDTKSMERFLPVT